MKFNNKYRYLKKVELANNYLFWLIKANHFFDIKKIFEI